MAATRTLSAENRLEIGKTQASKLRRKGLIPAVVYGHNKETQNICVDNKEFVKYLHRSGESSIVGIKLGDERIQSIVKEVQYHPISEEVLHVDFQRLEENEKIKLAIPIKFDYMDILQGSTAVMAHPLDEIEIQCMPRHIPEHSIHIDVKSLKMGDTIHVSDLELFKDENIEVLDDADRVVAALSDVKEMKVETETEEDGPIYESQASILS